MKVNGKYINDNSYVTNIANGNNIATDFVLTDTPSSIKVLDVFVDGLSYEDGYSLNNKTVTFSVAPTLGQIIKFKYIKKD